MWKKSCAWFWKMLVLFHVSSFEAYKIGHKYPARLKSKRAFGPMRWTTLAVPSQLRSSEMRERLRMSNRLRVRMQLHFTKVWPNKPAFCTNNSLIHCISTNNLPVRNHDNFYFSIMLLNYFYCKDIILRVFWLILFWYKVTRNFFV